MASVLLSASVSQIIHSAGNQLPSCEQLYEVHVSKELLSTATCVSLEADPAGSHQASR